MAIQSFQVSRYERNELDLVYRYLEDIALIPSSLAKDLVSDVPYGVDVTPLEYFGNSFVPTREDVASSLVLVHMTSSSCSDRILKPSYEVASANAPKYRTTVHFSLGAAVAPHSKGDWCNLPYAVLVPFEDVGKCIVSFEPEDVYVARSVPLSQQARVVNITPDRYKLAHELMVKHGIIDIETLNNVLPTIQGQARISKQELLSLMFDETWKVDLDFIKRYLNSDSPYYSLFLQAQQMRVCRTIQNVSQLIVAQEILGMGKLPMFYFTEGSLSDIFLRMVGTKASEHQWRYSGLARGFRKSYNRRNQREGGTLDWAGTNIDQFAGTFSPHLKSAWHDLELLPIIAEGGRVNGASDFIERVSALEDSQARLNLALSSILPGGELWLSIVKGSWRDARTMLYAFNVLKSMEKELRGKIQHSS